jgi:glycosyltransferase involved in cell wall biosynthesis
MNKLLSLCMIVKDEEKVLDRCLTSVQGLVDEIIIVDTGSTDRTKEIAAKYTDQIYDFKWTNNFAEARNESLLHATGRWILVLDADEYVQSADHDRLRQHLEGTIADKPIGYTLRILNFGGDGRDATDVMESSGARLFANGQFIRYVEPIHEQLHSSKGSISFETYPFIIFHTGYTTQVVLEKEKSKRNLSILEKLNKGVKRNDPYFCFILGNQYMSEQRDEEALEVYRRSLRYSSSSNTWYSYLLENLIKLEIKHCQFSHAYDLVQEAINLWPEKTDFLCMKGMLFESMGLWNGAEDIFMQCIRLAETEEANGNPHWIMKPAFGKIIPHQTIAEIKWRKGDVSGAVHHWIKVLQLQPKNYLVLQRVIDVLLLSSSEEQVANVIEKLYPVEQPMNGALLYKIALNLGSQKLVSRYLACVQKLSLQDEADEIQRKLLFRQFADIPMNTSPIPDSLATTAAIILNNATLARNAKEQPEASQRLAEQVLLALGQKHWDETVLLQSEDLLIETFQWLWRYGYSDLFDSALKSMGNEQILNRLGDWFYQQGLLEQAIDLYGILLDNGQLGAEGLRNVGVWQLNCGNREEAFPFLEASFKRKGSVDILGLYKEQADETLYSSFLKLNNEHFRNVPSQLFLKI